MMLSQTFSHFSNIILYHIPQLAGLFVFLVRQIWTHMATTLRVGSL